MHFLHSRNFVNHAPLHCPQSNPLPARHLYRGRRSPHRRLLLPPHLGPSKRPAGLSRSATSHHVLSNSRRSTIASLLTRTSRGSHVFVHFSSCRNRTDAFVERNYLYGGLAISVLSFLLAASVDTPPSPLDRLVGALMGLCGVIFAGMFAYGLLALWYLWKEAIQQLKSAKLGSLILSAPLALLGLAFGLGVFVALGMLVDKIPKYLGFLVRPLMWGVIAAVFYALWKGRSHAALTLRLVLLLVFSSIILAAIVWRAVMAARKETRSGAVCEAIHQHPLLRPLGPPPRPHQQSGVAPTTIHKFPRRKENPIPPALTGRMGPLLPVSTERSTTVDSAKPAGRYSDQESRPRRLDCCCSD